MPVDSYFAIRSTEDGVRVDGPMPKAMLLKRITPDKSGECYYGRSCTFLDRLPEADGGHWMGVEPTQLLVIRGDIIVPKAVSVAIEYDIPRGDDR
jgi:hypothetical protein